jgi:hypothetical protein
MDSVMRVKLSIEGSNLALCVQKPPILIDEKKSE